jgi:hypothetical protein
MTWTPTRYESADGTFRIHDLGPGAGLDRFQLIDHANLNGDAAYFASLEKAQRAAVPEGHKTIPCLGCGGTRICKCECGGEG